MGARFSKKNSLPANGSQESKEKSSNDNVTIARSYINDQAVSRECMFNSTREKGTTKCKTRGVIINESYSQPKVLIESLKYPSAAFNISSVKIQEPRIPSDDYSDKVVNITKLLAQLLNARVVLEKLEEPLVKYPSVRAIKVHTNIDNADENDIACETVSDDIFAQRYCTTCKKTKIARIKDPLAKNCPDCETAMMYLCTKCNVKYYKRYPFLKFHLDRCNGKDDLNKTSTDEIESDIAGKDGSTLIPDQSHFIVKHFENEVNTLRKWTYYCRKCDVALSSRQMPCCKCGENLVYMCLKCNGKYNSRQGMAYHLKSHCYQNTQYQCTHCDFTATCWENMRMHFKRMHTNLISKCTFCSYETTYNHRLIQHMSKMHSKSNGKLNCNSCSYSTKYTSNLRRHKKLKH